MIGKLLCRLGLHLPMEAGGNEGSRWGYCVRNHRKWYCTWSYQLDNPDVR